MALDVEKVLPLFLRKKLVTMTETVYPNRERYRSIWSFWHQTLATPAQVINDALYPARVGWVMCNVCLFCFFVSPLAPLSAVWNALIHVSKFMKLYFPLKQSLYYHENENHIYAIILLNLQIEKTAQKKMAPTICTFLDKKSTGKLKSKQRPKALTWIGSIL